MTYIWSGIELHIFIRTRTRGYRILPYPLHHTKNISTVRTHHGRICCNFAPHARKSTVRSVHTLQQHHTAAANIIAPSFLTVACRSYQIGVWLQQTFYSPWFRDCKA